MPSLDDLLDPSIYATPDGPLLARALVDHLAFRHGGSREIDGILRDTMAGAPFRDALYARTRLTMTALETGWQESIRSILASVPQGTGSAPEGAPDSTISPESGRRSGS